MTSAGDAFSAAEHICFHQILHFALGDHRQVEHQGLLDASGGIANQQSFLNAIRR